jgi:hypothetical protein
MMVAGADDWLEFLCDDGKEEVTLAVSTEWMGGRSDSMEIDFVSKDNWATYTLREYRGVEIIHTLCLCPVSAFVFGVHPKRIYYKKIS